MKLSRRRPKRVRSGKQAFICERVSFPNWMCFDNCPVCRLFKRAAEEGRDISEKEMENAFSEAEKEILNQPR